MKRSRRISGQRAKKKKKGGWVAEEEEERFHGNRPRGERGGPLCVVYPRNGRKKQNGG